MHICELTFTFLLDVATLFISSSLKRSSSKGISTSLPSQPDKCIAFESVSELIPSQPSAISGSFLRICAAKAFRTPMCCVFGPVVSMSLSSINFGEPNDAVMFLS